jgi:crotonobetainyl-CoA:carnitine CoA-transferase CaiB-like acyl-CoA transferase
VPRVAGLLRGRTTREWLAALDAAQVPCGPINDLAQVFAEPQVRHRRLRMELPHPTAGSAPGVANPVRFSRSAIEYERAPPTLGADTAAVLRERLGLEEATLRDLAARGIIA